MPGRFFIPIICDVKTAIYYMVKSILSLIAKYIIRACRMQYNSASFSLEKILKPYFPRHSRPFSQLGHFNVICIDIVMKFYYFLYKKKHSRSLLTKLLGLNVSIMFKTNCELKLIS